MSQRSSRLAHLARRGALLVACAALVACAGSGAGRSFSTRHVDDLRRGAQDKNRVQAWFGQPVRIEKLHAHPAGCTERWTYVHAVSSHARTRSESLVVDFDANELVCDHAYVEN